MPSLLELYRKELVQYLEKKETLTRENLLARERRGAKKGFLISIFPPISITALMLNYSKRSGLLYKSLHWFTPYSAGKNTVFFPDFKHFMGARLKDLRNWRSNNDSLIIRHNNMNRAETLIKKIDEGSIIQKDIEDQIAAKKKEHDSYYRLLCKLNKAGTPPEKQNSIDKPSNAIETVQENEIQRSKEPFTFTARSITLPETLRICDMLMGMDLSPKTYEQYVIKGVKKGTHKLVGGQNNQVLQDGWYEFVIIPDNNPNSQAPLIRYFPCGQKRTGVPFSKQPIPSRLAATTTDGNYRFHHPEKAFELKYEKFIAHSELSGGEDIFAGGAFRIHNGQLVIIEDSSGHYGEGAKDKYGQLKIACELFRHYGADTSSVILEHWEPFHGASKLLRKGAALLRGIFAPSVLKEEKILPQLVEGRPPGPNGKSPIETLIKLEMKR